MTNKKMPEDFAYLSEMYQDDYFPAFLVDKIKDAIREVADFLEQGSYSTEDVQTALDKMTNKINDLQEEFEDNESEIETVAGDSIGVTVEKILRYFDVDIEIEEAIRQRDW